MTSDATFRSSSMTFSGKSGQRYCFQTWPLDTKLKPMGGGVYIITARECLDRTFTTKASHRCLAIGQTTDLATTTHTKADLSKLTAQGANCVCVYPVADAAARAEIEKDLIDGNERWGGGLQHLFRAAVPPKPPGRDSLPE